MDPISMILNGILGGMKQREYTKDQTSERRWFEFYKLKDGIVQPKSRDEVVTLGAALITVPVSPDHMPGCEHEVESVKAYLRTLECLAAIKDEPFEWVGSVLHDKLVIDASYENKLFTDEAEIEKVVGVIRQAKRRANFESIEEQLKEIRLLDRRRELMTKLVAEPYGWDGSRLVFERILTDEEIDAVRHEWVFPDGRKGHTGDFAMSNANQHR